MTDIILLLSSKNTYFVKKKQCLMIYMSPYCIFTHSSKYPINIHMLLNITGLLQYIVSANMGINYKAKVCSSIAL